MIELYFLIYRIPKMMSSLARERNRSAVAWSLIGIASWLGSELIVVLGLGSLYGVGIAFWGWPEEIPAGFRILVYVLGLAAAIGGFTIARRILSGKRSEDFFPEPPPPPRF
jgi:hypothetical protein